ncbi:hypothetical protein F53441_4974 [Fusarium austroafricanum]|uniref:Uncharacterized protein n=1 Tax=Fusarium austroafricanum TaxID=2364996 RepID=A0A8H4KJ49_9HYPO|nr:hypothetical protein F53441_4974 [Fusarium austroafricanum]
MRRIFTNVFWAEQGKGVSVYELGLVELDSVAFGRFMVCLIKCSLLMFDISKIGLHSIDFTTCGQSDLNHLRFQLSTCALWTLSINSIFALRQELTHPSRDIHLVD